MLRDQSRYLQEFVASTSQQNVVEGDQPRPQGFSLKNMGKALGTRLEGDIIPEREAYLF